MATYSPAQPAFASSTELASGGGAGSSTPPQIHAVIAAAVHCFMQGRRHHVAAVVEVRDALDWAREGRRMIFASHKTR